MALSKTESRLVGVGFATAPLELNGLPSAVLEVERDRLTPATETDALMTGLRVEDTDGVARGRGSLIELVLTLESKVGNDCNGAEERREGVGASLDALGGEKSEGTEETARF